MDDNPLIFCIFSSFETFTIAIRRLNIFFVFIVFFVILCVTALNVSVFLIVAVVVITVFCCCCNRNRNLEREREHELEGERKRMHERDLQRERDHKNLLEKLRTTPMAAIAPTGPLSNPLPQMPRPQLPPFPTQAPLPSAQIQAPPIQNSDRNLGVLSTLPVAQYDSVSMATGSGADWFSSAGGDDAAREIYSSTNLGGGIYE